MTGRTYHEAVALLASLQKRGWRLGLERMREFASRAGLDDALGASGGPQFIHIAGTNGKGSVTATIQQVLFDQGWRTGGYFSPYVYDLRERVQLDLQLIPKRDFARIVHRLKPIADSLNDTEHGGPTEFEMKTAIGFEHWKRKKADWVALEVGLGGRLDSTNIVTPRSCAIVSIGWDHMHILGNTLGKIAAEKAGILKKGVVGVVGHMAEEARLSIERIAGEVGSPLWVWDRELKLENGSNGYRVCTPSRSFGGLVPGLRGAVQVHNMAVAVAAMEAAGALRDPESLAESLLRTRLPGRFEVRTRGSFEIILDGAHNYDAGVALARSLFEHEHPELRSLQWSNPPEYEKAYLQWRERCDQRYVLVTGMLLGHDPEPFYEQLSGLVRRVYIAPVDFERTVRAEDLQARVGGMFPSTRLCKSSSEAVRAALRSLVGGELLLVTGSFYLVGEVGRMLDRMKPASDSN